MKVTGIQFLISGEDFSPQGFSEHVESFYRKSEPGDMLVFPEDIGLLTAFSGIEANSTADAMQILYQKAPEDYEDLSHRFPDTPFQTILFLMLTDKFAEEFYGLFRNMSEKYSVYTVACNNMPDFELKETKAVPADNMVYNSAYVFGPDGSLVARQKKVYLTEMEEGLGFTSGTLGETGTFRIGDFRVGIAISLDAFSPGYLSRIADADLILQPDANPVRWNSYLANGRWQPEEWMDSSYYIAQRLNRVQYVVNPMMVGKIMEIGFEGESNITKKGSPEDKKMSFTGNLPVTGFKEIIAPEGYDSSYFYDRESISREELKYSESTVTVDLRSESQP